MASSVELYLLSSGALGLDGLEVPVPFALIRHPKGNVVVDGGIPLAAARDPHEHWGGLADQFTVHMSEDQHCVAQLLELGVEPGSVDYLVQTHLHIDHTGALGHFPTATAVVHARELQAALAADSPTASGYVRQDFDRPEIRWQLIDGDLDLFGDQAVRLIATPGHSAGHMSLLLELVETGPVLLTADACDNRAQWEGRALPRALCSRRQATRSLESLRDLAVQTNALIVFGHDPANWSQLKHPPYRYS